MSTVKSHIGGFVVKHIGQYKIIEGIGTDKGKWGAVSPRETVVFNKREAAEIHADAEMEE